MINLKQVGEFDTPTLAFEFARPRRLIAKADFPS